MVRFTSKWFAALAVGTIAVAAGTVPVVGQNCRGVAPRQCTTPREQAAPEPKPQSAPADDEPQPQAMIAPQVGSYVAPPANGEVAGESRSMGVRGLGIRIPEIRLEMPTVQLPSLVRFRRGPEMHLESGRAPFVQQSAAAFGQIHTGGVAPMMMQSAPMAQAAPAPQSRRADPKPQSAPADDPKPQAAPAPHCTPYCPPPHCTSEAKVRELRREMEAARERILALQGSLEEAVAEVEQDRGETSPQAAVDAIPEESSGDYRSSSRRRRLPREEEYDEREHDYDYGPAAPRHDDGYEPEVEVGSRSRRPARYAVGDAEPVEVVRDRGTSSNRSVIRPSSGPVATRGGRDLRTGDEYDDVDSRTTASRTYRPEDNEYAARRVRERASVESRLDRTYSSRPATSGGEDYEVDESTAARRAPTRYSEARTPSAPKAQTQRSRIEESDYDEAAVAGSPYQPQVPRANSAAPKLPTARRPR